MSFALLHKMLALKSSMVYYVCLRFKVVMVVTVEITVFRDVVPCDWYYTVLYKACFIFPSHFL